jgi:RNA polymerase sigma-70 factor (ECF subfamily)
LKRNLTQKRNSGCDLVLEELSGIISEETADFTDSVFIKDAINSFLAKLSSRDRRIFVQRYWYMYSAKEIAEGIGKDDNFVNVKLHRLRSELKKHLESEGITL